ncbi:MAG: OmpA family protein [Bacteroidia bacterium]|nr:OmpA family protein [Bacteroidia bacterium]
MTSYKIRINKVCNYPGVSSFYYPKSSVQMKFPGRIFYYSFFLLITLLAVSFPVYCQSDEACPEPENEKAAQLYEKAISLPDGQHGEAKKLLLQVVKMEPEYTAAWYILADIYYQTSLKNGDISQSAVQDIERDANKAFNYYEKVIALCPAYDHYFSCFVMGRHYYYLNQREKSMPLLKSFIDHNPPGDANVIIAGNLLNIMQVYFDLVNNPVPFNPVILKGVSSKADEFLPLISPDNEYAFYTRRGMMTDVNTTIQKETELFMFSDLIKGKDDQEYTAGEQMPAPFNTSSNQGGVSITIDNNHMYFTRCDYINIDGTYYNNCDIFRSDKEYGTWSDPVRLGSNINGRNTWESQPSISSDGKTLYFASARPGGFGGSDIYYSEQDAKGEWGKAQNLGKVINTEGDEKSPFIHSDSKTLYFSSNGRPGVGGFDIFYSKQLGKNEWSDPVNIGYPINTEDDDLGFSVSIDGSKAYFSSNKLSGQGGFDIYSFDLYQAARPYKVMFMKGQITDDKGKELSDAQVEMASTTSEKITEGMVDKISGRYAIAVEVEPKEEFIMTVRKNDYTFSSEFIKPTEEDESKTVEVNMRINPIEVGVSFEVSNVLFATNSAEFDNASRIILGNLLNFLTGNPHIKLAIYGHTDNVGSEQSNLILSEKRAKAVLNFLLEHGITANRLVSKGFGFSKPVASNDTEEGRAQNRRTEFVILEK